MRLLVCAAASMLLFGADALALDDTPTQPTYVWPREVVRAVMPVKRVPAVAIELPVKKRAPLVVLAQEKIAPPPCREPHCAPESPLRGRDVGSP